MKHIIAIVILLMLLAVAGTAKAQSINFAPIGAEWYYETQTMFTKGYIKMMAEKDTVIDGHACLKLAREEYWHNLEFGGLYGGPCPPLFLSQENDSVMVYQDGVFKLLFDFGAEINDTLTIAGREGRCPEDFGILLVVDKGIDTINGIQLRYITVKDLPDSYWGYGGSIYGTLSGAVKIVERIGPRGYMLPEQRCVFDDGEGGPLRCYIDDDLGELHFSTLHPERYCDYISETYQSVDETALNHKLSVFPNPCTEKLCLNFGGMSNCEIMVFDYAGKMVLRCSVNDKETELDLGELPAGLYCVTANDGYKVSTNRVVKQ
jgi:hypothetical protein